MIYVMNFNHVGYTEPKLTILSNKISTFGINYKSNSHSLMSFFFECCYRSKLFNFSWNQILQFRFTITEFLSFAILGKCLWNGILLNLEVYKFRIRATMIIRNSSKRSFMNIVVNFKIQSSWTKHSSKLAVSGWRFHYCFEMIIFLLCV